MKGEIEYIERPDISQDLRLRHLVLISPNRQGALGMKTPRFASWHPLQDVTQPSPGFQVSGVGEVI